MQLTGFDCIIKQIKRLNNQCMISLLNDGLINSMNNLQLQLASEKCKNLPIYHTHHTKKHMHYVTQIFLHVQLLVT